MDLTPRQIQLIKVIVEEFTTTGKPVGSQTLDKKYRLGVSPATIRNEMTELVHKGFLAKPHLSAGRLPTALAIKFYVNELLRERDLTVAEEVAVKERVWDSRSDLHQLLREATRILAERTGNLSVATTANGLIYHSGYANLLNSVEFYNIDLFREVLALLDQHQRLSGLFDRAVGNEPIHLLVGDEFGSTFFEPISCLFADIRVGSQRGSLAVLGPNRQHYDQNIPLLRYVANLINKLAEA